MMVKDCAVRVVLLADGTDAAALDEVLASK